MEGGKEGRVDREEGEESEVIRGRERVIDEATHQTPESDADKENKRC